MRAYCGTNCNSPVSNKGALVSSRGYGFAICLSVSALPFFSPAVRVGSSAPVPKPSQGSLFFEIRLARLLRARTTILNLPIPCVNHSKSPSFGRYTRLKMYSSVTQLKSTLELGGQEAWILVFTVGHVIESEENRSPRKRGTEYLTTTIGEKLPRPRPLGDYSTRRVRLQGMLLISGVLRAEGPQNKIDEAISQDVTTAPLPADGRRGHALYSIRCLSIVANSFGCLRRRFSQAHTTNGVFFRRPLFVDRLNQYAEYHLSENTRPRVTSPVTDAILQGAAPIWSTGLGACLTPAKRNTPFNEGTNYIGMDVHGRKHFDFGQNYPGSS